MPDSFEPDLRQGLRARATRVSRPDNPAADVRRRLRRQDTVQRSLAAVGVFAVLALVGVAGVPLLGSGGGIELDPSPPASQPDEPDTASEGSGEEDAETSCSAAGLSADADSQPALPTPAAETREQLIQAAVACDFEALGELAGDDFTPSFGDARDPVALWRGAEADGDEPLRALVELLSTPHATRDGGDADLVVWPAAYARDSWDEVSAEERQALRPLYDDEDFERFAEFGSYIGYRVGIRGDGTWLFFVAGD